MLNPLFHSVMYKGRLTLISILIQEGIMEKISYERRVYESVEDGRLSLAIFQKSTYKIELMK